MKLEIELEVVRFTPNQIV